MNGELLPVWSRMWKEVWLRLARSPSAPVDLFVELVSGLAKAPQPPALPASPPAEAYDVNGQLTDPEALRALVEYEEALARYSDYRDKYETALNSETEAREFFRGLLGQVANEPEAVKFLENCYLTLAVHDDVNLTARFRDLVCDFLKSFSLRYELRGEFSLNATIPGLFTKLIAELKQVALTDAHLANLLSEFEEAFADLKTSRTQARMKTCLQKQFNILEALGRKYPNVTANTLGAICDQLDWPHEKIKEVGKNLYKFGSDYPGLRHGGSPNSALRILEMKDFVSLSLMLASFTPYVTHGLDSDRCYSGA